MRLSTRVILIAGLLLCLTAVSSHAQCPDYFEFHDSQRINPYPHAVDGLGDINNDGYDDFIYIAEYLVIIRSGRTGDTLRTHPGGEGAVAAVGDINGDGASEYIAGRVVDGWALVVYSGIDGSQMYTLPFSRRADGAGDFNNDGTLDIAVGGIVRSGDDGSEICTLPLGSAVAGLGDVNGDGYDDVAVGYPGYDGGGTNRGRVYIIGGKADADPYYDTLAMWTGRYDNDAFGGVVANAGDVNNDGRNDVIIGHPESSSQARALDSAWVYSGTGSFLFGLTDGGDQLDRFGTSVDGVGDINHDGRDDFAVSAYRSGNNYGRIYIYSGLNASLLDTRTGSTATAVGPCIAGVGDVNNDGVPDIAANAYMDSLLIVYTCIFQSPECQADADNDADGRGNMCDNCPDDSNPNQEDTDHDGIGDACDDCADPDWDGYGDPSNPLHACADDNCPDDSNADQADGDSDGVGDVCDNCPDDPNGNQADSDSDGVGDECDNCLDDPNPSQVDTDGDTIGDVCDNCRYDPNTDQADGDGDNFGDVCDNCPEVPGGQYDYDGDGIGDYCDECSDLDGDGYGVRNLTDVQTCELDNCEDHWDWRTAIYNPDQTDSDGDDVGDACDVCPDFYDPEQHDWNSDGRGDSCVTWVTVPEGDDVEVDMGEGVTINFEDSEYHSQAEIFLTDNDPPPAGVFSYLPGMGTTIFNLYYYGYDAGETTICIDYDDSGLDPETELTVGIYHYERVYNPDTYQWDTLWIDFTSSLDTDSNVVCGVVDEFSPFAVGTAGGSISCCTGVVGDVNASGDADPTIGDVSYLIDALFISVDLSLIDCLGEADVNLSGGSDPQESDITIGDLSLLIDLLFITVDLSALNDCP